MNIVYKYYKKQYKKAIRCLDCLSDEVSEEKIHDFRITLKKIKSVYSLMDRDDLYAEIEPLYKITGKIRDLHVQKILLKDYKLKDIHKEIKKLIKDEMNYWLYFSTQLDSYKEILNTHKIIVKESDINIDSDFILKNLDISVELFEKDPHEVRKIIKENIAYVDILGDVDFNMEKFYMIDYLLGDWHDMYRLKKRVKNRDIEQEKYDLIKFDTNSFLNESIELYKTI